VSVRSGAIRTSQGLELDASIREPLRAGLDRVAASRRGGRLPDAPASTAAARVTEARISERGAVIGIGGISLEKASPNVQAVFDPAVPEAARQRKVGYRSLSVSSWGRVLDALTRQAGVCWTIAPDGAVTIVPIPR
jgi:hypothetical protein